MGNTIEAAGISKSFGPTLAVDDLALHVAPGEAYGLVGPDGAGKTTTIRMLAGVIAPDRGSISVEGVSMAAQPTLARARLGYLSQRFSLYSDLSVLENLRFFGEVRGMDGRDIASRVEELTGFVGLRGFERRLAGHLSGGMKQKLSLACALVHRPRLLLLDEPTAGVDPIARQEFWQLVIRLLSEGVSVLVSTPYMDEALRCHRIGFLHHGRLLRQSTPQSLLDGFRGVVLDLSATPGRVAQRISMAEPGVEEATLFGDRLHLHVRRAEAVLASLPASLDAGGVHVEALRVVPPTLEDAFIALLREGENEGEELWRRDADMQSQGRKYDERSQHCSGTGRECYSRREPDETVRAIHRCGSGQL